MCARKEYETNEDLQFTDVRVHAIMYGDGFNKTNRWFVFSVTYGFISSVSRIHSFFVVLPYYRHIHAIIVSDLGMGENV